MSSAGSTQKAVLAMPPPANSPGEASTLFCTGSSTTENPSPTPCRQEWSRRTRAGRTLQIGPAGQVVARHVGHGAIAQQADAVELTAATQELDEPGGSRPPWRSGRR